MTDANSIAADSTCRGPARDTKPELTEVNWNFRHNTDNLKLVIALANIRKWRKGARLPRNTNASPSVGSCG